MHADWSVEVGAELPSIDVPWSSSTNVPRSYSTDVLPRDAAPGLKFIDLRSHPEALSDIAEAQKYPALGKALSLLNSPQSLVFTSKCDAWALAGEEVLALDLDAAEPGTNFAIAAYLDVLLREAVDFASFELHENWLRRLTDELRVVPIPAAQVDLTLRWAQVEDNEGFAITVHATGCGSDEASALQTWEAALAAVVELVASGATRQDFPTSRN